MLSVDNACSLFEQVQKVLLLIIGKNVFPVVKQALDQQFHWVMLHVQSAGSRGC